MFVWLFTCRVYSVDFHSKGAGMTDTTVLVLLGLDEDVIGADRDMAARDIEIGQWWCAVRLWR